MGHIAQAGLFPEPKFPHVDFRKGLESSVWNLSKFLGNHGLSVILRMARAFGSAVATTR